MSNIITIENKLREIAKSFNLAGDGVEFLIKSIAYSQYESETTSRLALLESSPDTAVHENSKLKHAMNNMYSAFRGINPKLEVKIQVTSSLKLERFQEVYSDRSNTFYYSHVILPTGEVIYGDYTFSYGLEYTVVLYKSDSIEEEYLSVEEGNKYLLETLSGDISEIYELKEVPSDSSDDTLVSSLDTVKDFGKHIDSAYLDSPLIFEMTSVGWGLRFYSPDSIGFNSSTTYLLKYLPFTEVPIDETKLFKFRITGAELDLESIKVYPAESKELLTNLVYNLKRSVINQSRVKSNDDVVDVFKSLFKDKIRDAKVSNYNLKTDLLTLSYIPKDSEDSDSTRYLISEEDVKDYKDALLHYVTDEIEVISLRDETSSVKLDLTVDIIMDGVFEIQSLLDVISKYDYILGNSLDYNKLVGEINNLDGVRYAIVKLKDMTTGEILTEGVNLRGDKYFTLINNLTYSYKK